MENPIRMDDLGVPLFLETPIYIYYVILNKYIYKYVKRGREGEKDAATLIYMARASVKCGSFQEDAPYYGQGA